VRVHGRSRRRPPCPACGGSMVRCHGNHHRRLRDLPWLGRAVELRLRVRRFRCSNRQCRRRTFTEQFPGVVAARGRATLRLSGLIRQAGYAVGGRAGSRLLNAYGVLTSDDTVLRRVKARPREAEPGLDKVRVLGVDDWEYRATPGAGRRVSRPLGTRSPIETYRPHAGSVTAFKASQFPGLRPRSGVRLV